MFSSKMGAESYFFLYNTQPRPLNHEAATQLKSIQYILTTPFQMLDK